MEINMTTETKIEDQIPRTCANCACSIMQTNVALGLGHEKEHMFCRKDPVNAAKARFERPAIRNGQPVIDKRTNKPQMETYDDLAFMYRPVIAHGTCYDGWRPIGTEPGDKFQNAGLDKMMEPLLKGFGRLYADMTNDAMANYFAEHSGECTHGQKIGEPCSSCPDGKAELPAFSNLYDLDGDPKKN
jgi:hypothetical protein